MNPWEVVLLIIALAFVCEFIDSSLGMGYGTTLTPLLLLLGYQPLQIIPALLLSEFAAALSAGYFHHLHQNVNFKKGSKDLKIALTMSACSVAGALIAVMVAVKISALVLKLYISLVVIGMGIVILSTLNQTFRFSWRKIISLGLFAAFNKGISGGGYGPIVTGGQILSGVNSKNAVGITAFAESLTCLAGVVAYALVSNNRIDWKLAPYLIIGALLSVPLATLVVKKIKTDKLKLAVGLATLVLGLFTLGKTIL